MHEDGIGMARTFEREFHGRGGRAHRGPLRLLRLGRRRTRPRATAPRAPWPAARPRFGCAPLATAPVAVLTGPLGAQVLTPLVAALDRDDVRVVTVDNQFFGGNIGVTGLMVGDDLDRVLGDQPVGHRYLLPDVCLSQGRFLDGRSPEDLPRPVEVVATDGVALRQALQVGAR